MLLKRKCPVCGAQQGVLIKRLPLNLSAEMRSRINYPDHFNLVSCDECGMLFSDISLTKADVDNYYVNCNMYDNASNVKSKVYDEGCKLYYDAISPYITEESRIIDIGCGNGNFLDFLKVKGFKNLYGMDPSESSIQKLKENEINGLVGNIYDRVPEKLQEKFDIVIFSFVFEHLLIPESCLKNLISLMKKPNGILYIAVPNAIGFKKYLRELPNYFNQEHINYFTPKTLDYFCARNGLHRCSSEEECYHVMCPSSPEMVISAVYCQTGKKAKDKIYDESGKESAIAYLEKMEQYQEQKKNAINVLLEEQNPLIIWGTGGYATSLLCDIPALLERVVCFVDNDYNKQSNTFFGKEVISPDKLINFSAAIIVVCVMMDKDSIVKQIQDMNISNRIFLLP